MSRVAAPSYLTMQAHVVDWDGISREQGRSSTGLGYHTQLRWLTHPAVGLQATPFRVYQRVGSLPGLRPIGYSQGAGGRLTWDGDPMAVLRITVRISGSGTVTAWPSTSDGGGGVPLPPVTASGSNTFSFHVRCPHMSSVRLDAPSSTVVLEVYGITSDDYANLPDWQLVETVGLPVSVPLWNATGYSTGPQGPPAAPLPPRDAALRRLTDGAPRVGWYPTADTGQAAPAWSRATPAELAALVDELDTTVLARVRGMLAEGVQPFWHHRYQTQEAFGRPSGPGGTANVQQESTAGVPPLGLLLLAAGTDPYAALCLGFGTVQPYSAALVTDWMVTLTAQLGIGFGGQPFTPVPHLPLEMADFVMGPGVRTALPAPGGVEARPGHRLRPAMADMVWSQAADVVWSPPAEGYGQARPASYAVLRDGAPMLSRRKSFGWRPYRAPQVEHGGPGQERQQWTDPDVPHPTSGARVYRYSVAAQDIYGGYSPWRSASLTTAADPPQRPEIADARLTATWDEVAGAVTGTLTVDFAWDWTDRSPEYVEFEATVAAPVSRTDPLPKPPNPGGIRSVLGGPVLPPLRVTFNGVAVATAPGQSVRYLDEAGTAYVAAGPFGQGERVRRYRIDITGFTLAYAPKCSAAVAVWARAAEHIRPTQPSASTPPFTALADNPAKPALSIVTDTIQWASPPDAAGISRATLRWDGPPEVRYVVYTASESSLRQAAGMAPPDPDVPPLTRLADLRTLGTPGHPSMADVKSVFRRVTERAVAAEQVEVELPRGSRLIHAYVVVPLSGPGVLGDWPADARALIPVGVSHLPALRAPEIEVAPADAAGQVRCHLRLDTATPVDRVLLYRTDNERNATSLGRMGPPRGRSDTDPGWTFERDGRGRLTAASVADDVTAGWAHRWYRAVAWSADDPVRGALAARSEASAAARVLLPPAGPPVVADAFITDAYFAGVDLVLTWSMDVPVAPTPLGPHILSVIARDRANGNVLMDYRGPLHAVPAVADVLALPDVRPAVFRAPGQWFARIPLAVGAADVTIRVSDPLGRTGVHQISWPMPVLAGPMGIAYVPGSHVSALWECPMPRKPAGFVITATAVQTTTGLTRTSRPVELNQVPSSGRPDAVASYAQDGAAIAGLRYPNETLQTAWFQLATPAGVTVRLTAPDGTFITLEGNIA